MSCRIRLHGEFRMAAVKKSGFYKRSQVSADSVVQLVFREVALRDGFEDVFRRHKSTRPRHFDVQTGRNTLAPFYGSPGGNNKPVVTTLLLK